MTNRTAVLLLALPSLSRAALPASAQEDRDKVRAVYEAVHKSFVAAEITLRKKSRLEKAELEEEAQDAETQRLQQLAENGQPFETWGIAIEKDLVLMADRGLKEADIEKIALLDASGARFEGRLHAVGRRHDFVMVKPSSPRDLVPLAFSDWQRPALGETFHVTYADRVDGLWHLNVSPYIQTNAELVPGKDWFCVDALRPGSVVSDKAGATVGIALDNHLWVAADGRSSFLGKALLADERITNLEERYEAIRKSLPEGVKRVEIAFRSERPAERFAPPDEGRSGRAVLFGVALDAKGTLLIPELLTRDQVRKIEDITVAEDGKTYQATFVGAFKGFGALVVRADGLATKPSILRDARPASPGDLFFTALVEDRFGRSRTKLDTNRVFRTETGLGGAPRLQPRKRIRAGSFLLDFEGHVAGFATVDKKEDDLDEMALDAGRERYYGRYRPSYLQDYLRRLIFFSEIAEALKDPAAHFDTKAVPMTKKEEKRLVWLGVEFQEISKPVAEALRIQERDLTNDGRRGLVVTEIYAGSPAARAGLKVDDILLSVRAEGDGQARDLAAEPDRYAFARGGPSMRGGGTPWKPTRNYLTTILTEMGAAKKVTFERLRGKEKSSVSLTLELAPMDYETAEKHKDDALGYTVKDLTYEVRHFQKVEPDATGVVVARLESGTKADIAKLLPLSIITRVNDTPVKDLEHFKQLVASAKNLTLTTLSYGQTKLVELARD